MTGTLQADFEAIAKRMHLMPDDAKGPYAVSDEWAVATDGRVLFAVSRAAYDWPLVPPPDRIAAHLARWVTLQPTAPLVVPVSALRAFARADLPPLPNCETCSNTGTVTCEECDGSGSVDCTCDCGHYHDAECEACEDGEADCSDCERATLRKRRVGALLGGEINTVLLADVLRLVPDNRDIAMALEPNVSSLGNLSSYLLRPVGEGQAWVALVMPLTTRGQDVDCTFDATPYQAVGVATSDGMTHA